MRVSVCCRLLALRRPLPTAALSLAPARHGGACHHSCRTFFDPPALPPLPRIPTAKRCRRGSCCDRRRRRQRWTRGRSAPSTARTAPSTT
ncbi:hypothetical protein STCU_11440 [Strigomonas culicis]|uniref:Uncharacterized protein n=1 Tax=Strigomonas culicis TaxID=28005 RepID=S9TE08_9TRYP|nr:hypothetical protein STCU_11440 [Strigomonas culicis]|eukprot:EPY16272.1 hypothetical protein STCU_11440 [Strigomonas culicis]